MLSIIEQAQEYLAQSAGLAREAARKLWEDTDPEVRKEAARIRKESFFTEENRDPDKRQIHHSPCESHHLVIDSYTTGKGTWNYTRGRVYHHNGDNPIADVKRNYSSFPFAWMPNHGVHKHDYLVCGADYQGQTFIDLTTGERRDLMSDGSEKGWGFCWAAYDLMPDGVTLKVEGCHWACPYEYRLFNVADPINKGWPELEPPEDVGCLDEGEDTEMLYEDGLFVWQQFDRRFIPTGERNSVIEREGSRIYRKQSEAKYKELGEEVIEAAKAELAEHEAKYPDHEDEPDKWEKVVDHIIKLRNENGTLVLVEEWKSDHKLDKEAKHKEWREKDRAKRKKWEDDDPILQALMAYTNGEARVSGWHMPSQVMKWKGEKNPAWFHVKAGSYENEKGKTLRTETLIWGVEDGSIRREAWVYGKGTVKMDREYPRTTEGVQAAWDDAKAALVAARLKGE